MFILFLYIWNNSAVIRPDFVSFFVGRHFFTDSVSLFIDHFSFSTSDSVWIGLCYRNSIISSIFSCLLAFIIFSDYLWYFCDINCNVCSFILLICFLSLLLVSQASSLSILVIFLNNISLH